VNNDKLKELIAGFDVQTDLWWLTMMLAGLLAAVLGAFAGYGLFFIYLSVLLRLSIALGLSQQAWGAVFGKLLTMGLVSGVFSIFADYMAIRWFTSGRLEYARGTASLLESPLYMPLAWACMVVEFGYPIVRIYGFVSKRWAGETGMSLTMLAGGTLAAVLIGSYEFLAIHAGLWRYTAGHGVVGTGYALYVVVAKFFIFGAFLRIFAGYLACPGTRLYAALRYGIIFAGVIFMGYGVAYLLVVGAFA
jgi:hypothetical protein